MSDVGSQQSNPQATAPGDGRPRTEVRLMIYLIYDPPLLHNNTKVFGKVLMQLLRDGTFGFFGKPIDNNANVVAARDEVATNLGVDLNGSKIEMRGDNTKKGENLVTHFYAFPVTTDKFREIVAKLATDGQCNPELGFVCMDLYTRDANVEQQQSSLKTNCGNSWEQLLESLNSCGIMPTAEVSRFRLAHEQSKGSDL
jgi:hypothetical protein